VFIARILTRRNRRNYLISSGKEHASRTGSVHGFSCHEVRPSGLPARGAVSESKGLLTLNLGRGKEKRKC